MPMGTLLSTPELEPGDYATSREVPMDTKAGRVLFTLFFLPAAPLQSPWLPMSVVKWHSDGGAQKYGSLSLKSLQPSSGVGMGTVRGLCLSSMKWI